MRRLQGKQIVIATVAYLAASLAFAGGHKVVLPIVDIPVDPDVKMMVNGSSGPRRLSPSRRMSTAAGTT